LKKLKIGFLLFPNLTQLDLMGPLQVLHRLANSETFIVSKNINLVKSDCQIELKPTHTYEDCPDLDLLCVPGGFGVIDLLTDQETLCFVEKQANQAQFVTSVCTGAFVLGAAGLLAGKRATTHWAYADLLPSVGAIHEKSRIVRDGKIITSGGVTAGIDLALIIISEVAGTDVAKSIQLGLEYDPEPPYDCGHPDRAPEKIRTVVGSHFINSKENYREALKNIGMNVAIQV